MLKEKMMVIMFFPPLSQIMASVGKCRINYVQHMISSTKLLKSREMRPYKYAYNTIIILYHHQPSRTFPRQSGHTLNQFVRTINGETNLLLDSEVQKGRKEERKGKEDDDDTLPVYLFQPFINTKHMKFMVAWKDTYFITLVVLSQANVTPKKDTILIAM